jgi:hypothetical protein
MTILGWPKTQFQKKNNLAFIEGHHTNWFPTYQQIFRPAEDAAEWPATGPDTGNRD